MSHTTLPKACACGQPLYVRLRWNGREHVPYYYAATETGGAALPAVTHCPNCGEPLAPEGLEDRPE